MSLGNVIRVLGIHLVERITQFRNLILSLCSCLMGDIIKIPTFSTLKANAPLKHMHNGHIIHVFGLMAELSNDIKFTCAMHSILIRNLLNCVLYCHYLT